MLGWWRSSCTPRRLGLSTPGRSPQYLTQATFLVRPRGGGRSKSRVGGEQGSLDGEPVGGGCRIVVCSDVD